MLTFERRQPAGELVDLVAQVDLLSAAPRQDSPAEGEGFEPSVSRKRDRTSGANVRSSERESALKHKSDGIRLPILPTHLH
jgi:hypothetical protein